MPLMERVATLLRANVNDLIDRAEDPQKMVRQLLLDMENQLLQVKTQVAMAIADEHLLQRRHSEELATAGEWRSRAGLAVKKGDDDLARLALERALSHDETAAGFARQVAEQSVDATALRATYNRLQLKLQQTQSQAEMLIAEARRVRRMGRATAAQQVTETQGSLVNGPVLGRFKARIEGERADTFAGRELLTGATLEDKFVTLEREEKVDRLLSELKQRDAHLLSDGASR